MKEQRSAERLLTVEVCGGIAYGKTTLTHLVRALEVRPTFEDFQTNPFYAAFYQDPTSFAFETEVTFTLQHYHQIKVAKRLAQPFCTDFSPYLDLAYSRVTLQGERLTTYARVYELVRKEIQPPSLLVHLECEPEVALGRIQRRGRSTELGIQLSYLKALDSSLREVVDAARVSTEVLRIDSHAFDFANDDRDKAKVLELIRTAISVPLQHVGARTPAS